MALWLSVLCRLLGNIYTKLSVTILCIVIGIVRMMVSTLLLGVSKYMGLQGYGSLSCGQGRYGLEILNEHGQPYLPYQLDGIPTIGVFGNEAFKIRFYNRRPEMVQVKLSVDGRDVLTAQQATLNASDKMWVVRANGQMELVAWPENSNGGAKFVFTSAADSVAVHTPGNLDALGYISAAIFTEGYRPPVFHSHQSYGVLESMGSVCRSKGVDRGGPGVGAGEYARQDIGTAKGLIQPEFSEIIQIRFLWYDDLVAKLEAGGYPVSVHRPQGYSAPGHPTGFASTPLADLRGTPRVGNQVVQPVQKYPRFQ